MAIDPSIPLQVQTPNPLAAVASLQQVRGQQLQQASLGQQIAANRAASQAFQQATDPQTGQVDYNKLTALLANSPAAYNLPQIQGQIAQQKLQNQQLTNEQLAGQTSQLDLTHKRLQYAGQQLGALLQKPDVSQSDITTGLATAVQNGMLDPARAAQMAQEIPADPAARLQWLKQHYQSTLDAHDQLTALNPQVMAINAGNRTELVNTNMASAAPFGQIGTIQNGLSPEAATQPTQIFNPATNRPEVITRAQFAQQQGGSVAGPGSGQAPGLAAMGAPGYTGAYPGASAGGGIPTGPSLGQAEAAGVAAKGAGDRFNELQTQANNVRGSVQGYDRALQLIDSSLTGPGNTKITNLAAVANSLGFPVAKDKVTDTQELSKYLSNAGAQAAAQAGFSGSDARASAFSHGQPNVENMGPDALKEAVRYVRAQQLGTLAKSAAANNFVQQTGDYSQLPQFEAKWNKAYDPEAMYYMTLDKPAQIQYAAKLTNDQKAALGKGVAAMNDVGAFNGQ